MRRRHKSVRLRLLSQWSSRDNSVHVDRLHINDAPEGRDDYWILCREIVLLHCRNDPPFVNEDFRSLFRNAPADGMPGVWREEVNAGVGAFPEPPIACIVVV